MSQRGKGDAQNDVLITFWDLGFRIMRLPSSSEWHGPGVPSPSTGQLLFGCPRADSGGLLIGQKPPGGFDGKWAFGHDSPDLRVAPGIGHVLPSCHRTCTCRLSVDLLSSARRSGSRPVRSGKLQFPPRAAHQIRLPGGQAPAGQLPSGFRRLGGKQKTIHRNLETRSGESERSLCARENPSQPRRLCRRYRTFPQSHCVVPRFWSGPLCVSGCLSRSRRNGSCTRTAPAV